MYIVNTTYVVDPQANSQWLQWLQSKLLPELGDRHLVLTRVLSQEAVDHLTYSLQIDAADVSDMQAVREIVAWQLPFGEQVLPFTSILKKIDL